MQALAATMESAVSSQAQSASPIGPNFAHQGNNAPDKKIEMGKPSPTVAAQGRDCLFSEFDVAINEIMSRSISKKRKDPESRIDSLQLETVLIPEALLSEDRIANGRSRISPYTAG